MRVKVAKSFSPPRLVLVAGRRLVHPRACKNATTSSTRSVPSIATTTRRYRKPSPTSKAAVEQLPVSEYAAEAEPLTEQLAKCQASRRGPQTVGHILPIVLARLGFLE